MLVLKSQIQEPYCTLGLAMTTQIRNRNFLRRSFLYVPGDSLRKLEKAASWETDAVILDLEDGVAPNQKLAARQSIVEALTRFDFGSRERLVRINPLGSGLAEDDLTATVAARPDGYVVSKVESAEDLVEITYWLDQAEELSGWQRESLRLSAMIETPLGIMNLREICMASTRLDGLIFGAEDFAASVGAIRTPANWEVFYARSAIVTAAAAYNLQAIDQVYVDLNDLVGLEAEAQQGRQLGFAGKTAIHPKQTSVINRAFSPTTSEIDHAQRLVEAFAVHQESGQGAFAFEGKMVDLPVVKVAQRILERSSNI